MSGRGKRRVWSAAEKLRIVLTGMESGMEISELCRREGISPTQYYGWKRQLVSSAAEIFEDGRRSKGSDRRQERLEAELTRAKNVIAEITAENLELKKGLSV